MLAQEVSLKNSVLTLHNSEMISNNNNNDNKNNGITNESTSNNNSNNNIKIETNQNTKNVDLNEAAAAAVAAAGTGIINADQINQLINLGQLSNSNLNQIKEVEEFKKIYNLLNTYQQNPNFIAAIAAAAAAAAVNNTTNTSINTVAQLENLNYESTNICENSQYKQLERNLNKKKEDLTTPEQSGIFSSDNSTSSGKRRQNNNNSSSFKLVKALSLTNESLSSTGTITGKDPAETASCMMQTNLDEDCALATSKKLESKTKLGKHQHHSHHHSHHHNNHHHHHHHRINKTLSSNATVNQRRMNQHNTTTNISQQGIRNNIEDIKLNISVNSSTQSSSSSSSSTSPSLYSSSSTSSSPLSSSSSAPSSPTFDPAKSQQQNQQQQKQQHQQQEQKKQEIICKNNMNIGKSEEELNDNENVFNFNKSNSISVSKLQGNVFIKNSVDHPQPPKPAASATATSTDVKQRLKQFILQKLDKNNNNSGATAGGSSNHNQQQQQSPMSTSNRTNYQNDIYFKKQLGKNNRVGSELQQNHQQQTHNPYDQYQNQHSSYMQLYQYYNAAMQQKQQSYTGLVHLDENNNHQIQQISIDFDENNLRRTTSEPNLKVKSALKDRLLEKRNLLNPFPATSGSIKRQANTLSALPAHIRSGSKPASSKFFSPSLSHIQQPSSSFSNDNNNQYHHQLATTSSLGSLPHYFKPVESTNQVEMSESELAASALLGLSNSSSSSIVASIAAAAAAAAAAASSSSSSMESQEQTAKLALSNIAATLQQFVYKKNGDLESKQQQQQPFMDSLVLAAAMLNQQQQRNMYNSGTTASMSYPMLLMPPNVKRTMTGANNNNINNMPKFGHTVHVEEENEIMLENELKSVAKLNDTHMNYLLSDGGGFNRNGSYDNDDDLDEEEEDDDQLLMEQRQYNGRSTFLQSNKTAANTASLSQHRHDNNYTRLNRSSSNLSHHLLYNQHGNSSVGMINTANRISSIEKAQCQLMELQYKQELEEHKYRQQEYQKSKLVPSSYFSDPYLLKSLENASIGSNSNLGSVVHPKNSKYDTKRVALTSNTAATISGCELDIEEKSYRFTTGIVYDDAMLKHECTCNNPSNHLETPDRLKVIWARLKSRGDLIDSCELVQTRMASISDLLIAHSEQYALIFGSDIETRPKLPKEYLQTYMMNICLAPCQGLALTYDQDNLWNEEHTPTACRVAIGSTYELASLVSTGKLKNGFALVRPPGSHAEFNKPLGFCYFNTVAIVAKLLKKNFQLERILIVDWDVHHGNGTQQMTYNDPNIMYISLHRHDNGNFFPGTGSINECGQDAGLGKNVNIAWNGKLNPAMGDTEYLAAFRCVVMPIAKEFKPQIVLVSCGFDATENHPKELGGYKVSPVCFGYMTKKLMSLADGKVILVLEGGYDKKSLCDSSEMCIKALQNRQIASFSNQTLDSLPNTPAIQDLENIIDIQRQYWPNLNEHKKFIKMSHNQFISIYTE